MELKGSDYRVWHDESSNVVYFEGSLRLNGDAEYAPITELLTQISEKEGNSEVNVDFKELEFLNSAGMNMLYKFVLSLRKKGNITMNVYGKQSIAWQDRALGNLKKFLPTLTLNLD